MRRNYNRQVKRNSSCVNVKACVNADKIRLKSPSILKTAPLGVVSALQCCFGAESGRLLRFNAYEGKYIGVFLSFLL